MKFCDDCYDETEEVWKDIPEYKGFYMASNKGRIKSITRGVGNRTGSGFSIRPGKLLSCPKDADGYPRVTLSKKGQPKSFYVHNLIMLAFVGTKKEHEQTMHLDGDPGNNNLENLRYGSHKCNAAFMIDHGTIAFGDNHKSSKLSGEDVRLIKIMLKDGFKGSDLAKIFNTCKTNISSIKLQKTWKHIWGLNVL